MDLLEYFKNQQYKNVNYIARKCYLPKDINFNLFGVRGSGKTSIILDFIQNSNIDSILYIDMDNPNLIFHQLNIVDLQQFIDKNNIEILILDHYTEGIFSFFPKVDKLIVISRIKLKHSKLAEIELFPLDYEEFLAFETILSHNKGFNHFLRSGTLPALAGNHKNTQQIMQTFFKSSFNSNEQKLLLILAQHHTKHLTTHQIYTFAKEKFKVSKDWLYRTMKLFIEEKLIIFIDNHYKKSGKKMLLFDFAFAKYLTIGQPFIMQFDTMVTLTLIKHHIDVKTLGIHGYITKEKELIISAPFESEESLWVKSQGKFSIYKKYGIKKVTIVTIANTYEYHIEKLHFEALPFNEWSVLSDEER
jgi:hypothetical protein